MGIRQRLDAEKTVEVLLYITERCSNVYNALKILYFADKDHLERYGRLICGDTYIAMRHGPVPSAAYDIVKCVRGDGICCPDVPFEDAFAAPDHTHITPGRKANLDLLSESDIECLDAAIEEIKDMPFSALKKRSHDEAYKSSDVNDVIALEDIIKTLPSRDLLLAHFA